MGITSPAKSVGRDKQQREEYESQLVSVEELTAEGDALERKAELEEKLDDLYDSTDEKTKQLQEMPKLSRPVAATSQCRPIMGEVLWETTVVNTYTKQQQRTHARMFSGTHMK